MLQKIEDIFNNKGLPEPFDLPIHVYDISGSASLKGDERVRGPLRIRKLPNVTDLPMANTEITIVVGSVRQVKQQATHLHLRDCILPPPFLDITLLSYSFPFSRWETGCTFPWLIFSS
jgi:hypothetical protein